jgi:hypothetical protein
VKLELMQKIGTTLPKTWVQEPGQDLEQYKAALRVGANLYNQLATDALAVGEVVPKVLASSFQLAW